MSKQSCVRDELQPVCDDVEVQAPDAVFKRTNKKTSKSCSCVFGDRQYFSNIR